MKLPYVSRVAFEAATDHIASLQRQVNEARTDAKEWAQLWERAMDRSSDGYDALLEKYHALRSQGFAPIEAHAFPLVESPLSKLGPLTQAALAAQPKNLSRVVRDATNAAALSMYAQGLEDAVIAEAVRKGETLRRVG